MRHHIFFNSVSSVIKSITWTHQPPTTHNKKDQTTKNKQILPTKRLTRSKGINKQPRTCQKNTTVLSNTPSASPKLIGETHQNPKKIPAASHYAYRGNTWLATTNGLLSNSDINDTPPPGMTHAQKMGILDSTPPPGLTHVQKMRILAERPQKSWSDAQSNWLRGAIRSTSTSPSAIAHQRK